MIPEFTSGGLTWGGMRYASSPMATRPVRVVELARTGNRRRKRWRVSVFMTWEPCAMVTPEVTYVHPTVYKQLESYLEQSR